MKKLMQEVMKSKKAFILLIIISTLISLTLNVGTILILTKDEGQISQVQNVNINSSPKEDDKININTATFEELKSLSGIGDKLAIDIINNRPYKSIHDLKAIKGISDTKFNSFIERVTTK